MWWRRKKFEEEELEEGSVGKVSSRRRTKKKEPPKPWGKKERFLILLLVFMTTGISVFLSLSSRSWKLPGLPRLKLPSYDLSIFKEQIIVIEPDTKDHQKSLEVMRLFENESRKLSGLYGLYVVRLGSGSSYGVNENERFQAASLIKLPVMLAMYIEFEEGRLDPEGEYILKDSDKLPGAGSLQTRPAGYKLTYRDLVRLMGIQSDNTAFNISRRILGEDRIRQVQESLGMTQTSLDENKTTPRDIGAFFEALWKAEVVFRQSRDEILDFLTDTEFEDWLPAGVPEDVRVSHKYGREVNVLNDAGIVFADEPFVLVLMGEGIVVNEAKEFILAIATRIYEIEAD